MRQLLMWSFWFSLAPPPIVPSASRVWGAVAIASIIAAFLVRAFFTQRAPQAFVARAWARAARFLAVNGVLLLVLWFFRYEGVPFFGARFWPLLLGIGDLAWLVVIVRYFLVQLPAARRAWAAEQQKRKYLK